MNSTPALHKCGIQFPDTSFLDAAKVYVHENCDLATFNHCLRSAAFALLFIKKIPPLSNADKTLVVYSCFMHDLGWATNEALSSKDKRFEIDGADAARAWLKDNKIGWTDRQMQLCWDAIALHTTPSIAKYKEAEVAVTNMGISADFFGPNFPGGLITVEQYQEIVEAFPRAGFHEGFVPIMCGLCIKKPETTYDNFVSQFGVQYGLPGGDNEEFKKQVEEHSVANVLVSALSACKQYEIL